MASIIQKKRLTNEVKLLAKEPLHYCSAYPDESNPLIWYFLLKGQKKTDYHTGEEGGGGEYIGKIVHSPKYPAEPPDYYMLTPSGRYNVGSKICLTNSSYHKGDWSSTWNIISILIAFYSIWLDDKESGISHIKDTPSNRKRMASESVAYNLKNNRAIYEKFDRTHLRDDAPVILKKKIVCNEEQTQSAQETQPAETQPEQETKNTIGTIGTFKTADTSEMKIMKELKEPELKELNELKELGESDKKIVINIDDMEEIPKVKKTRKYTKKTAK